MSASDQPTQALTKSRAVEDSIIESERVTADSVLRDERTAHPSLLSDQRAATDHDLTHERTRVDQALALRDEFMGIVSHDLLNMINVICGLASVIAQESAPEHQVEQVVAHARRVQRCGVRMRRLVGDLVDVASIEAGCWR